MRNDIYFAFIIEQLSQTHTLLINQVSTEGVDLSKILFSVLHLLL